MARNLVQLPTSAVDIANQSLSALARSIIRPVETANNMPDGVAPAFCSRRRAALVLVVDGRRDSDVDLALVHHVQHIVEAVNLVLALLGSHDIRRQQPRVGHTAKPSLCRVLCNDIFVERVPTIVRYNIGRTITSQNKGGRLFHRLLGILEALSRRDEGERVANNMATPSLLAPANSLTRKKMTQSFVSCKSVLSNFISELMTGKFSSALCVDSITTPNAR